MIRALIDLGAKIDNTNISSETPLHVLIVGFYNANYIGLFDIESNTDSIKIAKMLLDAGADIDALTTDGRSALATLRARGGASSELEAFLLAAGATEQVVADRPNPVCTMRTRRGAEVMDIIIPCASD